MSIDMAVVDVINSKGENVSRATLSEAIFDVPVKESVLHDVVRMQMARRRSGTAAVKHRSDVAGSTKKLFRQKGTGRARRGNIKSPLLRGGGSVFGPDPRSYDVALPKKVRRLALRMALSAKLRDARLTVIDGFELNRIKTRDFVGILEAIGKQGGLIVTNGKNDTLKLSARNVPGVKVLSADGLNVYDLLRYPELILVEEAVGAIEGRLSK
jgi:large subunit ribosomal protein L4